MNDLDLFLNDVPTKDVDVKMSAVWYIFANEFGWSQRDFEESEIPYILAILDARTKAIKKAEADSKKKK